MGLKGYDGSVAAQDNTRVVRPFDKTVIVKQTPAVSIFGNNNWDSKFQMNLPKVTAVPEDYDVDEKQARKNRIEE